jgi:hypothetical protein
MVAHRVNMSRIASRRDIFAPPLARIAQRRLSIASSLGSGMRQRRQAWRVAGNANLRLACVSSDVISAAHDVTALAARAS